VQFRKISATVSCPALSSPGGFHAEPNCAPKKKEKREKKKYMVVKTKLREQTGEPGYNPKLPFKFRATLPWCRSPFASTLPILQINHHEVSEISY
jgi:hypothetical protein